MRKLKYIIILLILTQFTFGCSTINYVKNLILPKKVVEKVTKKLSIPVKKIYEYGKMAEVVYKDNASISEFASKNNYQLLTINELLESEVKYFAIKKTGMQYIVIRGTKNANNIKSDITAIPMLDEITGIMMHKGFKDASLEIFSELKKLTSTLKKGNKTTIIGHSLGGAIAAILGLYLYENNYYIEQVVTFGQPKFTNENGMKKYQSLPLIRIAGKGDVVVSVPPSSRFFEFIHSGLKVSLDNKKISYSKVGDEQNKIDDTPIEYSLDYLRSLDVKNHKMIYYLKRLKSNINKSIYIQFKEGYTWKRKK